MRSLTNVFRTVVRNDTVYIRRAILLNTRRTFFISKKRRKTLLFPYQHGARLKAVDGYGGRIVYRAE